MKRALVFSGGGARGAYEIGAWQALAEMGVRFQGVYGTSIGALNAGLFAQGDLELARALWSDIRLGRIVDMPVSEEAFPADLEVYNKFDIVPLMLEHHRLLRLDPSPLMALMREHLNEGRVRASGMQLGVMTVRIPQMAPVPKRLNEMPEGQLADWLMASASCFPVFAEKRIDGEMYVDGGYFDNLPIDMAIQDGADEVVAIEVHPHPIHAEYGRMPFLKVVHPLHSLGAFLDFNPKLLTRSRLLGYHDTLKAYGRLDGIRCSFRPIRDLDIEASARRFMGAVARFDAAAITRRTFQSGKTQNAPVIGALSRETPLDRLTLKQVWLRGLELAAEVMGFREDAIYSADEMIGRIRAYVSAARPAKADEAALRRAAAADRRELLAALTTCVDGEMNVPANLITVLAAYPAETAAALFLGCCG